MIQLLAEGGRRPCDQAPCCRGGVPLAGSERASPEGVDADAPLIEDDAVTEQRDWRGPGARPIGIACGEIAAAVRAIGAQPRVLPATDPHEPHEPVAQAFHLSTLPTVPARVVSSPPLRRSRSSRR